MGFDKTIFVKGGNRNNVYHKAKATQFYGIVDRDFLSDDDVIQIRRTYPKLYVLNYYSVENYLYHPDNLESYYKNKGEEFDKLAYISQLTEAKNEAKEKIIPTLSMERMSYPYFGEHEYNSKPLQNRFRTQKENKDESIVIAGYLNSNDFETYYKSLPMKSYCTQLPQRQNLSTNNLAKTIWFKEQISALLQN